MKKMYEFKAPKQHPRVVFNKHLLQATKMGVGTMLNALSTALLQSPINRDQPINLTIQVDAVAHTALPGFDELFTHIESLQAQDSYTSGVVAQMDRWQQLPNVQTMMLTATNVQLPKLKKAVRRQLMASSELNLAYVQTMTSKHKLAPINSWIDLFDHELAGKKYGGQGKLTAKGSAKNELFNLTEPGLQIVVPCVRRNFIERETLVTAIFENLWLAILQQKLVVTVIHNQKTEVFDETTLRDLLINYREVLVNKAADNAIQAAQYLQVYKATTPREIKIGDNSPATLNAHVRLDAEKTRGSVGIFAKSGLKLVDLDLSPVQEHGYTAVLIADADATAMIKRLANKAANKLNVKNVPNGKNRSTAKAFLKQLEDQLLTLINHEITRQKHQLLSPDAVMKMALTPSATGITQQELGPYLPELQALQAQSVAQYQQKFNINLMIGGRYSNRFAWDKIGINAWTQGADPYIMQMPPLDLATYFPSDEVVTFYTPEGTKLTARLTGQGAQARLTFIDGNIYEYIRRSLKLAPKTIITLAALKQFGTNALTFERLTATKYALKFGK